MCPHFINTPNTFILVCVESTSGVYQLEQKELVLQSFHRNCETLISHYSGGRSVSQQEEWWLSDSHSQSGQMFVCTYERQVQQQGGLTITACSLTEIVGCVMFNAPRFFFSRSAWHSLWRKATRTRLWSHTTSTPRTASPSTAATATLTSWRTLCQRCWWGASRSTRWTRSSSTTRNAGWPSNKAQKRTEEGVLV